MPASVQIADDDVHNHPGITQISDNDVHNHPEYSLSDVPDFEKPVASTLTLAPGNEPDAFAHVSNSDPNHVFVDDPSRTDQPVIDHEVYHQLQNRAAADNYVSADKDGNVYNYGSIDGLDKMMKAGKTTGDLNDEQQAQVLQDYTAKMQYFRNSVTPQSEIDKMKAAKNPLAGYYDQRNKSILKQADKMNQVYGPAIHQLSLMANQSKDTIDTSVKAPGPPPAELTGAIKPVSEVGGKSVNIETRLPTQPAPKGAVKKPSWSAAAASALGRR
jgi:hypothetical protein